MVFFFFFFFFLFTNTICCEMIKYMLFVETGQGQSEIPTCATMRVGAMQFVPFRDLSFHNRAIHVHDNKLAPATVPFILWIHASAIHHVKGRANYFLYEN